MGFLLALSMMAALPTPAAAVPKVLIDGHSLFVDVPPQIQNSRVMVPMSAIFKALGADITWIGESQTVVGKKNFINIILQVGKTKATVNDQEIDLDCPPVIIEERTLVPVSFIARAFGAEVIWDEPTETVSVVLPKSDPLPSNKQIMKELGPTVVELVSLDKNGTILAYGSGVTISADGGIVTNYHVIDGAAKVKVKLENGKTFMCEGMTSFSEERDIAILKIDASGLPKAEFGDSDKLSTGDSILTIGCPQGLERTMSDGLVSAIRTFEEQKYIQISAPIDHGSSGGALIERTGKVVGITCATIEYAQNLNFAVPINDVKNIMKNKSFISFASVFSERD